MQAGKIIIIFYFVAAIGAIALCGRMISRISTYAPERIIYVQSETSAVFSNPSEDSIILLELKKGDKLEFVKSTEESWVMVRNGPYEGYVRAGDTNYEKSDE